LRQGLPTKHANVSITCRRRSLPLPVANAGRKPDSANRDQAYVVFLAHFLAAANSEVLAKQFKRRFDLMRRPSDDQRFVLRHIGTYYRL
jgi:hypothetical protein